ncbi:testis-expressed protein 15 [Eleutherodactylus coqui]|uniref:testis-expressed protein 15 n=1 Tax=Eleutherodactylus coqui TaxID=57060 RepID=UPI003462D00A
MINGVSIQDFEQTKVNGGSAAKISLSPSSKVNIYCPETPENHTSFSTVIAPDKENAVPVVASPKTPSDGKEKHAFNNETHHKYCMLRDGGRKRRHASKQIFSQVRKLSLSLSKYSNKKSHTINEKNHLNVKKMKHFTTKGAKTSGLSLNKLSNILQRASETDSLKSLQNYSLVCQKMIPSFIKSFEKKQRCVLKDVVVDRKLFVKENLKTCFRCTLKPQAIEAFLELQMVMEISQFVENRMHFIEGKPTFRSLLWYDGSLYTELLTGESGYQQQSNFYSAFQEKLKLNPLATLENHYYQLSEYLQEVDEKYSSFYVYLKYKRELQECDDVLKHKCDYSVFSLSVPFSCGVHLGDTIDELTALQESTLEIIRTFINLPKCDQGKKEHALSLLEVISAKIGYIKTSVSTSLQLSLFGIEHLLFDAAKSMAFNERKKYCGQRTTITKELISQINSIALSKIYERYCVQCEQPVNTKNSPSSEIVNPHQGSEIFGNEEVFFFGKVIDQAQCAEPGMLKKVIKNCNQHLEFQSKCFQIMQECDVDEVLIQETNVLDMAERQDKHTTRLKSEAVEAYIDLAMTYETLHFLNCLMASKNNQMRTRGLLWYDTSLFSDLIHNQSKVQSLLQGPAMPSAKDLIDRTISEIKSELDVISNCSNSVNYTYAFQIMTRELSELSELKIFMKSKPAIVTYINFSPFVASLHFGNSLTDLNYNYNQLSDYLEVLLSTSKKDLGKIAHTLKIMKTIEFIKVLAYKPGISSFDFISCNVLHNRKKHSQALKRQTQEEKPIQNSHSFKTRTKVSTEDSTPSSSKKPKVLPSIKEKEENRVKSDIRPRKVFAPRYQDQHPVKRDCSKGSLQKKSKLCFLTSSNYRKEHVASASEVIRINGKDRKSSPLDQYKIKKLDSLAGKCQEASATTDTCEFTLDSKDQPRADSKCVYTSCPESIISIGSEHENASKPSDVPDNKLNNKFSEQKDLSNLSVCSMDTNTSEKQENMKELKSATGEQEEMEKNICPIGTQEVPRNESINWNNWSFSTARDQYPQFPAPASSWHCSLYSGYQNGNNPRGVTQGYPHVSFNTQSTNPYNSSSAFPLPNPYITNQTYPGFSEQIQAPMYSVAGSFGANMLYNYTDPSSSSTQNPVPMPYSYSSTGWPWGSWQ